MRRSAVLIPAHNEALTIREIVEAAKAHVDRVIVIDDGSTDGTAQQLDGLDIQIVRHDTNAGKGRRLVEGLELAFAEGIEQVITLDGDGQHDPESIPAFLDCAKQNPDALVLGDRSAQMDRIPKERALAIQFGNFFISWACVQRISDAQCGMRLYSAAIWKGVDVPSDQVDRFLFETAVLMHSAKAGYCFATVPIDARYAGFVQRPSHFAPVRDFVQLFALVTKFLFANRFQPRGLLVALGLIRTNI
ncbi:MAG: glycosyltransferase family 2 protein [Alphaproteobacteria bacterium]